MKILLGVLLAVFCARFVFAQLNPLQMAVTGPATGNVGTNIQYRITLTNLTTTPFAVGVTNIFPSPALTFISGTPTPASSAAGIVVFATQLGAFQQAQFTLTLRPTVAGRFTNFVVAGTAGQVLASDAIATTISGSGGGGSEGGDLSVSITPPPTSPRIFVDDWVSYSITVTKQSSGSIAGVVVTTTNNPSDTIFRRFSPGGTVSGNTLRFNIGTLSLQSTQLHVTIQPRTATTNHTIVARVSSTGDTNQSNNSATTTFSVSNPVLGQLTAARSSDQQFNPQTGLVDQLVTVSNTGTSAVASARLIITNFPFRLFNAVGTNDGHPFVVHGGSLEPTQSVELLLEYLIPDRTPKDDPGFTTYSAGTIDLSAPTGGSPTPITNIVMRPPFSVMTNHILLQFPSTNGVMYQILYSSNSTFSPAFKAEPPIKAPANWVQWIDYGPPKTLSRPVFSETFVTNIVTDTNSPGNTVTNVSTNANMRFYRAVRLP